jgi:hypothetical protein
MSFFDTVVLILTRLYLALAFGLFVLVAWKLVLLILWVWGDLT